MASGGDVALLLEAMKSHAATRQQHSEEPEATADIDRYDDSEVRERPPKTPPFDYYGNPVGQTPAGDPYRPQGVLGVSNYHGMPAPPPEAWPAQARREDYSEFLAEPLAASDRSAQPGSNHGEEVYDRGCVAEFGHCLKVNLCCTEMGMDSEQRREDLANEVPPVTADGDFAKGLDMTPEQRAMMREIDAELAALRQSLVHAKTSRAMRELDLRSELADVRRRTADMEEAYRREIAREISEKALLQAQLRSELLRMMEERVTMEIQLGRLSLHGEKPQLLLQNGEGPPPSGGGGNDEDGANGAGAGASLPATGRNGPGPSACARRPDVVAATDAARIPIEPPVQARAPMEPVSYAGATRLSPVAEGPTNAKDPLCHPEGVAGSAAGFSPARTNLRALAHVPE